MAKEIALTTRQHTIVGEPRLVGAALDNLQAQGRLVGHPTATRLRDGQIQVTANITEPTPRKSIRQRWSLWSVEHDTAASIVKALAFALAVLAALVAVLVLAGWLVFRTISALQVGVPGLILAVIVVFIGIRTALGHKPTCSGIHCSGCKG